MTTIIIIVLFITQLLSFYFLLILNSKISKFKSIEKDQEKLMREMEDTFSVYLLDMKEENDRLIREMSKVKHNEQKFDANVKVDEEFPQALLNKEVKQNETQLSNVVKQDTKDDLITKQIVGIPKAVAANAYKKSATTNTESPKPVDDILQTFESEVIQYYKKGMSIEEIAKKTQKGKTEIELLIKFHA